LYRTLEDCPFVRPHRRIVEGRPDGGV
jgi:hypothetical protein